MLNIKRLSTYKNEISKKQDIVISLCAHSDSISLKISLYNLWLSFRSHTKNHTVSVLSAMRHFSASLPFKVLANEHNKLLSSEL